MKEKIILLKALFWANITFIVFIWLKGFVASNILLSIARLCGLLSVNLVLTQFLLIGRIGWIEPFFGHDKLARIHHKVGKYAFYFIVLHFCLIIISYAHLSRTGLIEQFLILFNSYPDIPKAFIAFLLFIFIVPISIFIHRLKLKYETWYFIHLMLYVAVLFAFGHQLKLGAHFVNKFNIYYWYALYIFVLGNFALWRLLRPIYLFLRHGFYVEKVVSETYEANSFYIGGKDLDKLPRQSGQFMILRFLDKKRFWQAHPFSLSCSPDEHYIRATIKNSGDFTGTIQNVSPGTKILLDGFHGIFTSKVLTSKKVLLIAGGIGITPIRSMAEEFGKAGRDVVLLYSNKLVKDIIFKSELDDLSKKYNLKIHHILTEDSPANALSVANGERGRINKEKIYRLVKDIKSRDAYVCGPVPFMEAIIGMLKELGVKEEQIHFEKFSLH